MNRPIKYSEEQKLQKEIDDIKQDLLRERAKIGLDVAGIVDPTPISDLLGAGMAVQDGDFLGGILSLGSCLLPYVGDALAKPLKATRAGKKILKLKEKLEELEEKRSKLLKKKKKKKEPPPEAQSNDGTTVTREPSQSADSKKISDNSCPNNNCKKGDPVNTITGEVIDTHHDFTIAGRLPVVWERHYASQKDTHGVCGHNWQCPADARLVVDEDRNVIFHDGTPNAAVFKALPDDVPIMEAANGAVLERADGRLIVRKKSGLRYSFIAPGALFNQLPIDQITDANGNYLKFKRQGANLTEIADNRGPLVKIHSRNGRIRQIDAVTDDGAPAPLVRYEYDADGELIAAIDTPGKAYRFEYTDGMLTKKTDRNGVYFCYAYDNHTPRRCFHSYGPDGLYDYRFTYKDNETLCIDSLGNTSILQFDRNNLLTAKIDKDGNTIQWEYDHACRITAMIDQVGRRTEYQYDRAGNTTGVTRPDGAVVRYIYNDRHRPVQVLDPNGNLWQYTYNATGQLIASTDPLAGRTHYSYTPQGDLDTVTDPDGRTTRFEYDDYGHLAARIDPAGNRTHYKRNLMGRVTALTDALGRTTEYQYDAKGRLETVAPPSGHPQHFAWDPADNLLKHTDPNGHITRYTYTGLNEVAQQINPDETRTRYHYDTEENLTQVTDPLGRTYRFEYDPAGRLIAETDYYGKTTRFTYDAAGQLIQSVDPLERTIDYAYDDAGRLSAKTFETEEQEVFQWDQTGNLVGFENPDAQVQRFFDAANNLIAEQTGDFTVEYAYTPGGLRTQRQTGAGNTVTYQYDPAGFLSGLKINAHDPIRIDRDAVGRITRETFGPHLSRTVDYDTDDRISRQHIHGAGARIERRYAWDPAGQLRSRKDNHKGEQYFRYDPMGRIIEYTDPLHDTHYYNPDPAGDLAKPVDPTKGLRTDVFEKTTYRFDDAGNLYERETDDTLNRFYWDELNRLKMVRQSDDSFVRFTYDALGRRRSKRSDERTLYTWDGDTLLCEQTGDEPAREYVYYPGTFEPLALIDADQKVYYYHNDPNGLPQELTKPNGDIVWSAGYDALGRIDRQYVDEIEQPLRMQGQYFDAETGLCYNRFRYFDPHSCRFISKDPIGLAGGVNVYAYGPNVWNWVDPLGLCKNKADEKYLFRGTTEGYSGRYGVSPTSTDPAVAAHYASNAATEYGGKGVVHVIPQSKTADKILPSQRNALPHDMEVPLDIPPSEIPNVSAKTLSIDETRALLKSTTGESVPAKIYDQNALNGLLRNRTPLSAEQINSFLSGAGIL